MPETAKDSKVKGWYEANYKKYVTTYLDVLFKQGTYDRREALYVLLAAVIVALNTGFINGVCMSPDFVGEEPLASDTLFINKNTTQSVSGTGGSFTNTARHLVKKEWNKFGYYTLLILSYIFGGFIVGLISPRAHKHLIDPSYGLSFFIGAIMLVCASVFATDVGRPSRFIFFFATGAIGVQNGIASVYSANLIRCTLTGASTDLGLIVAQCLSGNFVKFVRGILIAIIVIFYWIGGLISIPIVEELRSRSLYLSAAMFFLLGCFCVMYTVVELKASLFEAITGTWKWETVVEKLLHHDDDDDNHRHSEEELINLFERIDGNHNDEIDIDELRHELTKTGSVTDFRLKVLMRAADVNGDGVIKKDEWEKLVNKLVT